MYRMRLCVGCTIILRSGNRARISICISEPHCVHKCRVLSMCTLSLIRVRTYVRCLYQFGLVRMSMLYVFMCAAVCKSTQIFVSNILNGSGAKETTPTKI